MLNRRQSKCIRRPPPRVTSKRRSYSKLSEEACCWNLCSAATDCKERKERRRATWTEQQAGLFFEGTRLKLLDMALNLSSVRDTKWLTLEVCRQFQRGNCSRRDEECKFAHPPKSCQVENGRVIACFDSLKGRCSRENCKYLHPPSHLKTQLEINGRNNLIQQKTAAAVLAQQMQLVIPGHSLQPVKMQRTDKLEVCREFQRGNCARGETDCRFAHPSDSPMIDTTDNTVTVCMDYIKSRCSREKCKYFHPPAHLQAKIKSNQQQVNQSAVAAQAAAVTQSTAKAMKRPLEATVDLAFPHSLLQSLPKRQALEKSSWASSLLSPSFLHYQHALANAHLQHPTTAYYPTVREPSGDRLVTQRPWVSTPESMAAGLAPESGDVPATVKEKQRDASSVMKWRNTLISCRFSAADSC
ncbi:hypothetical protein F2P81_021121 [Scophthalmus maximus]|uniref:C3H1-type domain-containing protein n=1 Tax=Scophthalmus maximus TaxID=52904 RepID=A0A6A4S721_SCOMX|nr:hypothetical protein F2P81_021121 [Scophthalmus maximus]